MIGSRVGFFFVLLLLPLLGGARPATGQTAPARAAAPRDTTPPPTLAAARITGPAPTLDGRLDDAAWAEAPVATGFVQRRPNAGAAAPSPTEVRVLYTQAALYVGARMVDPPDSIAAQLARRDAAGIYSDWLFVMLDSDDDNRSAYVFGVNPREVQRDWIVAEDGSTDPKWDAVWEVSARVDSTGWTAEFRIPLSQLRFNPGLGSWGVNFQRIVARREEDDFWAPIAPNTPGYVSRFGTLTGLAGLASPTRLELRPYTVARMTRADGAAANPFHQRNDPSADLGLDVNYSLTPALTLTATVNPDFGQVEADPSEVNLTAFETSFPEQRPFFVQDARIFQFNLGGSAGQLLYTRRIGAAPHGGVPSGSRFSDVPDGSTILGAAKVSGKTASGWSLGMLSAVTGREQARYVTAAGERERVAVEPLTMFSLARVSRDFRGGQSALGGIATLVNRSLENDELDFLRSSALTGGIDGRHRFARNYEVSGYVAGSHIQGSERAIQQVQLNSTHFFQRPGASHLDVDSAATSLTGFIADIEVEKLGGGNWTWELGARARSPGLEINDFGFQQQTDRIEAFGGLDYNQFRPRGSFRSWSLGVFQRSQWTFGRERLATSGSVVGSFELKNFWGGRVSLDRDLMGLSTSELRGGPALVIPGRTGLSLGVHGDRRKPVAWSVAASGSLQDQTDGRSLALSPSVALRLSPRWDLSLAPSMTWNRVGAQYVGQRREADRRLHYYFAPLEQSTLALTTRLNYTVTPRLSLQYYAQPFLSAGDFTSPLQVADPAASSFNERFVPATLSVLPDFNVQQFRSNAVVRWEYRPGSTLFVVWNTALQARTSDDRLEWADARTLFDADGSNVLLVKLSYWFGI
ncbi:MAG TPA: DUF5916 domain-containing protein [Longimicrobium sp.]|nr:DUF5916 domain-containing protein [Longimicrobium sp.]